MKTMLRITVLLLLCLVLCLGQTAFAEEANASSTSLTIPKNTTVIESEAFAGCRNITSVTIPASVTRIEDGAFYGCDGLREVHFNRPLSGFDISIGEGNDPLLDAAAWFSDGQCFIPLNSRCFPDSSFRGYIADNFDSDGDGSLSKAEIEAVTRIECYRMGISSLKGVEHFTNLTYLDCGFNNLSELDVSSNKKLQTLGIAANSIKSLDLSKNTALQVFSCGMEMQLDDGSWTTYGNPLGQLDVTHNTALTYLECPGCDLSSLDVSHNTALKTLRCWSNNLSYLNLSNNRNLINLACSANPLSSLIVDNNPNLESLVCQYCKLEELNLNNHTRLSRLRCRNNQLTNLTLSGCTSLQYIDCDYNHLTSLNLSGCTGLETLECQQNSLSSLNVSNCTKLKYLMLWRSGSYTSLNLSNNTALVRANLSANNSLASLTLGNKQNLEMLWVQNTNLSSLNISGCPTISQAYSQGTRTDFGRYGEHIDNGDWYGYKLGEGLNPDSSDPVSHCQFCVDKKTSVTA